MAVKNITNLKKGEISSIQNFTDKILGSKLISMGILPNASVELMRKTLFGSTYYVRVNNCCNIALRKQEALSIIISE